MEFRISKAIEEIKSYTKRNWLYIILTIVLHLLVNGYLFYLLEGTRFYEEKLIGSFLLSGICFAFVLIIAGSIIKKSLLNLILIIVLLTALEIIIGIEVFSDKVKEPIIQNQPSQQDNS